MLGCTPGERALLFKGFVLIKGFRDGYKFTSPVGSYQPNNLGIYDLGGNVWEWCEDKFSTFDARRVLRGCSWRDYLLAPDDLLSSSRNARESDWREDVDGFRVVVER